MFNYFIISLVIFNGFHCRFCHFVWSFVLGYYNMYYYDKMFVVVVHSSVDGRVCHQNYHQTKFICVSSRFWMVVVSKLQWTRARTVTQKFDAKHSIFWVFGFKWSQPFPCQLHILYFIAVHKINKFRLNVIAAVISFFVHIHTIHM